MIYIRYKDYHRFSAIFILPSYITDFGWLIGIYIFEIYCIIDFVIYIVYIVYFKIPFKSSLQLEYIISEYKTRYLGYNYSSFCANAFLNNIWLE